MMRATPVTRREMLHFLVAGALATFSAGYTRFGFAAEDGNFRAIYLDPRLREQFFLFLQNVFHLYPEQDFHDLIASVARAKLTDREQPYKPDRNAEDSYSRRPLESREPSEGREPSERRGPGHMAGLDLHFRGAANDIIDTLGEIRGRACVQTGHAQSST